MSLLVCWKYRLQIGFVVLFWSCTCNVPVCGAVPMSLVIGIDGLGYGSRGLSATTTPNIDRLANGSWADGYQGASTDQAFAGGEVGTPTQQRTSSGPGWTTILSGVWDDQHNVPDNNFRAPNLSERPSYLEILEESISDFHSASIVNWAPIDQHLISTVDDNNSSMDFRSTPGNDNNVTSVASNHIADLDGQFPTSVFIQFDEIDGAGHSCGSSGACYQQAIELVDVRVGWLLSAISNRPSFSTENWQIVLTSDHGHTPGGGHGGHSTLERTIPFIVSSPHLEAGMLTPVELPGVSHADVTPTVLEHFGVERPEYFAGVSRAAGADSTNPNEPTATLFFENFEQVPLGPNVEEDIANPVENVWTKTPPANWQVNDFVPGQDEPPSNNGVTEWIGWNFVDKDWWTDVAGDQNRSGFTRGEGVVAVADPDEWDDEPHPDSAAAGWYSTFLDTPEIPIRGVDPETLMLEFDSSWRPEFDDNYHQTANVRISFDGADAVEIFRWESDPNSPNFKGDSVNEPVRIKVTPPADSQSMVVSFGLFDAGNDWWWAIDNVKVTGDLIGDFDRDGSVGVQDIDLLTEAMIQGDLSFDLNQDGMTDFLDRKELVEDIIFTWLGDSNLDGLFDSNDLVTVFQFGKYETGANATWREGDWNGDGLFNSSDMTTAFQADAYESGQRKLSVVPEPTSALLIVVGWWLGILPVVRQRLS